MSLKAALLAAKRRLKMQAGGVATDTFDPIPEEDSAAIERGQRFLSGFGLGIPREPVRNRAGDVVFPTNAIERALTQSDIAAKQYAASFMGPGKTPGVRPRLYLTAGRDYDVPSTVLTKDLPRPEGTMEVLRRPTASPREQIEVPSPQIEYERLQEQQAEGPEWQPSHEALADEYHSDFIDDFLQQAAEEKGAPLSESERQSYSDEFKEIARDEVSKRLGPNLASAPRDPENVSYKPISPENEVLRQTALAQIRMARAARIREAVKRTTGRNTGGGVDEPGQDIHDLDPREVATWERTSGPLGSNPGGMHEAPDGSQHYVKAYPGLVGHDRTLNEQLTNQLYKAAGVPVADTKVTRWRNGTALSSQIVEGKKLSRFEPSEYPKIKDLLEHYPADAWLANYDVAGTHHNNIIVDDDDRAWRIDNGGGLRYRATGKPKEHWDKDATEELEGLQSKEHNKWSARLFKDVKVAKNDPSYQGAVRVSQVPDDVIERLVNRYGPGIDKDKEQISDIIKARRDSIAKAYGVKKQKYQEGGIVGPFGLLEQGNIDLNNRPVVQNPDGSYSTVRSMSFNEDGNEVLIPTVARDGSGILSNKEAIQQYHKYGEHLGKFDTPKNADVYAKQLHQEQAKRYERQTGGGTDDPDEGFTDPMTGISTSSRLGQKLGEVPIEMAKGAVESAMYPGKVMAVDPAQQIPETGELTEEGEYLRQHAISQAKEEEAGWGAGTALSMVGTGTSFAEPGGVGIAGGRPPRPPTNLMSLNRTHSLDDILGIIRNHTLEDALMNQTVTLRQAENINRLLERDPEGLAHYLGRNPNPNVTSWMSTSLTGRVADIVRDVYPPVDRPRMTGAGQAPPQPEMFHEAFPQFSDKPDKPITEDFDKPMPPDVAAEAAGLRPSSPSVSEPPLTQPASYPWVTQQRQWLPRGGLTQSAQDFLHTNILPHYGGDFKKFADSFLANHYDPSNFTMIGTPQYLNVSGSLRTPGGYTSIDRTINWSDRPEYRYAGHGLLSFPLSDQGSGIAKSLLANQVDLYRKMDLSFVKTSADIDVGRYSWGKYGFLPVNDSEWASLKSTLGRLVTNYVQIGRMPQDTAAMFREILARPDRHALWRFADSPFELPAAMQIGKMKRWAQELLINSTTWSAKLDLRDPESMRRFDAYVGKSKE
jgi:hypothetical protein